MRTSKFLVQKRPVGFLEESVVLKEKLIDANVLMFKIGLKLQPLPFILSKSDVVVKASS